MLHAKYIVYLTSLNKKHLLFHLIYKHPCNVTEKVLQVKLLQLRKEKNKIFSNLFTESSTGGQIAYILMSVELSVVVGGVGGGEGSGVKGQGSRAGKHMQNTNLNSHLNVIYGDQPTPRSETNGRTGVGGGVWEGMAA